MTSPAAIAAANPTNGLLVAYVTAAAVNAPASIIPSRAILITPDRSENIPPSAARISGVARRPVDQINEIVNRSLMSSFLKVLQQSQFLKGLAEESLGRNKQNNGRLQNLDDVL